MNDEAKNINMPKILVLAEDRAGNAYQAIALADGLGMDYDVMAVEYNKFAKLPNLLLSLWPVHVKKSVLKKFSSDSLPDIIISSGRRTAALALHIKKLSKNKSKIIQIMRPNIDPKQFAAIILPQHDSFHTLPNVIRVIGALNNVNNKIVREKESFKLNYSDLKEFIAVVIGGASKNYKFLQKDAIKLSDILDVIVKSHSLPLLITFSRRTPKEVKALFMARFSSDSNVIYDPADDKQNPYPAMLGMAKYIVATCDSISMCSEAVSTGKPVYLFSSGNFKLKKHRFFIQQLMDLRLARMLKSDIDFLQEYKYEPLLELSRVVEVIKSKIPELQPSEKGSESLYTQNK